MGYPSVLVLFLVTQTLCYCVFRVGSWNSALNCGSFSFDAFGIMAFLIPVML